MSGQSIGYYAPDDAGPPRTVSAVNQLEFQIQLSRFQCSHFSAERAAGILLALLFGTSITVLLTKFLEAEVP